ncbi:hypothetical protein HWV23_06970 [Natronomonas halophila]|uniref:hypothetical protein n=1 Tax=Natronomonas halophila TaxID=2747817 RepID=UPI0015B44BED|nr:hypothetical protein [Natronomonas halophila]QLD85476.1 hypothetical protein HWV23_06970 [Natronomonas halophila]
MSDESGGDESGEKRLSDDGLILALAGAACLLAANTAYSRSQPDAVIVFAMLAAVPALAAVVADLATDYVPTIRIHLLLGASALVGAAFAVPGRHYANIATLAVAGLMGLGRVFEVEYRGKES